MASLCLGQGALHGSGKVPLFQFVNDGQPALGNKKRHAGHAQRHGPVPEKSRPEQRLGGGPRAVQLLKIKGKLHGGDVQRPAKGEKAFQFRDGVVLFKNDVLVAVTGERMQMNDFVEVSAVVTHPNHTGKGYAKQLVVYTVNEIFKQNKTPYLHVIEDNKGAIQLYEKLGFSTRRKISFWNITK